MTKLVTVLGWVVGVYRRRGRHRIQGRIQDFNLGGGGAHLKKLRRAEGGAKMFGVFRVQNHDFTPKNLFFPILGGAPPPPDPPLVYVW